MVWMCSVCGYAYEGEDFLKEEEDFQCPLCDAGKENFHERDLPSEVENATNNFFQK